MGRRIKKAKITTISLVPKGANKMRAIYKDDGTVEFETLTKDGDELGELLCVVYAPDHRDSQGDIADAEVVKQMAHDFVANGANIDIRHDGRPLATEEARIAETFIVHKSDSRFHGWTDTDGQAVDLEGAWASVIKIDNPELRQVVRDRGWGVSMAGTAEVEHEKEDRVDEFVRLLRKNLDQQPSNEDQEMDETKLAETVAKSVEPLVTAVSALTESLKKEDPPKDDTPPVDEDRPVFKGDLSDDEALQKHERELQVYELQKAHDLTSAEGLRKFREARSELAKSWDEEDKKVSTKKSNQDVEGDGDLTYLAKDDNDFLQAGAELMKARQK